MRGTDVHFAKHGIKRIKQHGTGMWRWMSQQEEAGRLLVGRS